MKFPTFMKEELKTIYIVVQKWKRKWIGQCKQLKNRDLIIFENAQSVKSFKPTPHLQILAREFKDMRDPKILFLKGKNKRFTNMSTK